MRKGHLYQKCSGGNWFFHLTVMDKPYHRSSFQRDRSEAEAFVAVFQEDLLLRCSEASLPPPPTWREMVAQWACLTRFEVSDAHQRNVLTIHRLHLLSLHHMFMDAIAQGHVDACIEGYKRSHPTGTPEGIIRVLSLLLRWALAHRFLSSVTIKLPPPYPPRIARTHELQRLSPLLKYRTPGRPGLFASVSPDPRFETQTRTVSSTPRHLPKGRGKPEP